MIKLNCKIYRNYFLFFSPRFVKTLLKFFLIIFFVLQIYEQLYLKKIYNKNDLSKIPWTYTCFQWDLIVY